MFKKKISAEEVGKNLLTFMGMGEIISTNQYSEIYQNIPEDKKGKVESELFYLRIFALDYAVYQTLGNTPEKKGILDAFYLSLYVKEPSLLDHVNFRLVEYTNALKTHHELGPPFMIGKTFSRLCGNEKNLELGIMGSTEFMRVLKAFSGLLNNISKDYKIIV